jgi:hypothetical protein
MSNHIHIIKEAAELTPAASVLGAGWLAKAAALAPLAAPLVIAGGALVAWIGIRKNAEINRKRATLDMIEKTESTKHYQEILAGFNDAFDGMTDEKLKRFTAPKNQTDRTARKCIQQFLNHYELISIGILKESLDDETYRSWMMTTFVKHWNKATPYIQRERWKKNSKTGDWIYHTRTYENYEALAHRWSKKCDLNALVINKDSSPPPESAKGPGDDAGPITAESNQAERCQ